MIEAFLTNYARFRRGLVSNDLCAICCVNFETLLHSLHDYVKASECWKSFGIKLVKNSFFQQSIYNVLDETLTFQGVSWPLIFSTGCCLLWYFCNQFIFERQDNAHMYLFCRAMKLAKDYTYQLSLVSTTKAKIPCKVIK